MQRGTVSNSVCALLALFISAMYVTILQCYQYGPTHPALHYMCGTTKGVKPFQNQSSVLGADILNNYVLGCQQIDDWVQ